VIASANIRTFFGYTSVFLEKTQLIFKCSFNRFISFDLVQKKFVKKEGIDLIIHIFGYF
jgi:hypothetical protein